MEKGHGLTRDHSHTRPVPADVLIAGWDRGKPAAFDITVTSPLCPAILRKSDGMSGAPSMAAGTRKLLTNGPKCQELEWTLLLSGGLVWIPPEVPCVLFVLKSLLTLLATMLSYKQGGDAVIGTTN